MKNKLDKKNVFFEPLENFCGLDYLILENCPMYIDNDLGKIVDLTAHQMDVLAAVQIIKHNVPLRGREVRIIRDALNLSYEALARDLRLSAATIFKWERNKNEFISFPNDIVLKIYADEKLKCNLQNNFSRLSAFKNEASKILFKKAS